MVYLGRASDCSLLRKGSLTMESAQEYRVTAGWSSGETGLRISKQFAICARLRELGYASKQHVRLYGEEFHLISDPIPEGDGFAVEGIARRSGKWRLIRIPLSIVHTLRQELALESEADIAA